ncbi:uncharacterized protein RAG0_14484 [Rhynchosporium agropyri]|uniref:Peptidase S9 prolyl oligopeptidase catalytic domain-containing protein n=1 Tax=Rhynchosporium agropyri TaxID=914238 RepID=A0A1E1LH99_9HELO|nr:uncharacterized protein RAG0_14484 [Rhynchosporium agropyri]
MDDPRFENFNVTKTPYKIINDQEISLYVTIPKEIHTEKCPVMVHFHGGFLSNGLKILSDVQDSLNTGRERSSSIAKATGSEILPDYEKVAVYGENAGGYLAIQAGLTRPDLVKAIISAYPMTYLDRPWYAEASIDKSPLAHLNYQNESLYPARIVEKMKENQKVPFLLLMHGKEDWVVPCEHTVYFGKAWENKFGNGTVVTKFESGEHGFDANATLETPWRKDGLEDVTKAWIGDGKAQ